MPGNAKSQHYIQIDESRCNGCVHCMQACPTKAIRIREDNVARIEGACIDCGECIRACPRGAITAVTSGIDPVNFPRHPIIIASPTLYAQFGKTILPNDVLLALKNMFKYVYDLGYANEVFNAAAEIYLEEARQQENSPRPMISPCCPVINRLIAYCYPTLLQHLLPILTPREIAAKSLKERIAAENIIAPGAVGVYLITPCSAEMISIKNPLTISASQLDGAMGINELWYQLKNGFTGIEQDQVLLQSSGVGIGWAMSGGEISGLGSVKCLAVSGIQETVRYLEKIEMGYMSDLDYIEFRACAEGCLGGPMTAADRYQAKQAIQQLTSMFGITKRVDPPQIKKQYDAGWFYSEIRDKASLVESKGLSFEKALERQARIAELIEALPGKDCGVCGCPDCQTFAEDVADGKMTIENCLVIKCNGDIETLNQGD